MWLCLLLFGFEEIHEGVSGMPEKNGAADDSRRCINPSLGYAVLGCVQAGGVIPLVNISGVLELTIGVGRAARASCLTGDVATVPLHHIDGWSCTCDTFEVPVPARCPNEFAHEGVDITRVLGDEVEIKTTGTVLCEHTYLIGDFATGGPVGEIVMALIDQEDGSIGHGLPVLEFEFLPAKLGFDFLLEFESSVVIDLAVFLETALTHPFEGEQGFSCSVGASDQMQHVNIQL